MTHVCLVQAQAVAVRWTSLQGYECRSHTNEGGRAWRVFNFSNHKIGNMHAGPSYIAGTRHDVHTYS